MAGAGTGQPISFACPKCRSTLNEDRRRLAFRNWRATGRVKPLTSQQRGTGGGRVASERYEYECLLCSRKGWSRHNAVKFACDRLKKVK